MTGKVPSWGRHELTLTADQDIPDPTHDVTVRAQWVAPSGARHQVLGFWDGGRTWRVRFRPDEPGTWHYTVDGLGPERSGQLECVPHQGTNPLYRHGEVRVAVSGRHLAHADGTPFLYLADTAWNGPMKSTPQEWEHYLADRVGKRFTAVQYLSTPFRACPGTGDGHPAYHGKEHIAIEPRFFQWLDSRVDAINEYGLLAVPLMLHAGADTILNVAHHLAPDQLRVLARYLVARYGAHHVLWTFLAEARYHGENAPVWRALGREVYDGYRRAPVTMHPHSRDWVLDDFLDESWMDVIGYQSGHGGDEAGWRWIVDGPPSKDWRRGPPRPYLNLEPPYEGFASYSAGEPFDVATMRRAMWWSLLVSPTAGVAYGAHGVWGWDDGTAPPLNHPESGTPLPWRDALRLPGSLTVTRIAAILDTLPWWELLPCPELLRDQPGAGDVERTVVASRTGDGAVAVVYTPAPTTLKLDPALLPAPAEAAWWDPRTGERQPATLLPTGEVDSPASGDHLLVVRAA